MHSLCKQLQKNGVSADLLERGIRVHQISATAAATFEIYPWGADPRVPVLYFTHFVDDGVERPASVEETRNLVDRSVRDWISPTEHPVTGLRTLFLHPCNTLEWLEDTGGDWWLWLQCIGPLVGMHVRSGQTPA